MLTPAEVARVFGVSERTLEKWRRDGNGLKFSKVGRRVLYTAADVRAYIDERKGSSTADFERYRPGVQIKPRSLR